MVGDLDDEDKEEFAESLIEEGFDINSLTQGTNPGGV